MSIMDALNNPIIAYMLLLAIGAILAWGAKHMREGKLRDAVKMASSTAAGLAYAYQADRKARGLSVPTQHEAVELGVDYLANAMPDALAHFGKSKVDVTEMVTGELGKLLAADPTVSVLPPNSSTKV
jgi:hypothetical protein